MKRQRASFTLEAVIVMSTIIFIIFAIISAFLLLYQNAVMYYVATKAAQEGAVMWTDPSYDSDGLKNSAGEQNVYYRVAELFEGGGYGAKKAAIAGWAENKLKELTPGTMIGSGKSTVSVEAPVNYGQLFRRTVEVEITKEISIPFKEVAKFFGADLNLTVKAKAAVAEPAEAIRNIDYALQLWHELWDLVSKHLGKLFK